MASTIVAAKIESGHFLHHRRLCDSTRPLLEISSAENPTECGFAPTPADASAFGNREFYARVRVARALLFVLSLEQFCCRLWQKELDEVQLGILCNKTDAASPLFLKARIEPLRFVCMTFSAGRMSGGHPSWGEFYPPQ